MQACLLKCLAALAKLNLIKQACNKNYNQFSKSVFGLSDPRLSYPVPGPKPS